MKVLLNSLLTRLVGSFLLVLLVTLGLVIYTTYNRSQEALKTSALERLKVAVIARENNLNQWVNERKQDTLLIARTTEVRRLAKVMLSSQPTQPEYQAAYTALLDALATFLAGKTDLQEIMILSRSDGTVIVSTDKTRLGESQAQARYFVQGKAGTFIQNIYAMPATNKLIMTIATPLADETGQALGVLAMHLNVDSVGRMMSESSGLGLNGEIYLVNPNYQRVSFGEQPFAGTVQSAGVDAALAQQDGDGLYLNYRGTPVIGAYRWVDDREVALLAEMPQAEALAPARQLGLLILSIGLVASVILAVLVYAITRRIISPMFDLVSGAQRITAGQLDQEVKVRGSDELGTLARAFNAMQSSLRQSRSQLEGYARTLEQRVAERTSDLKRRSDYLAASAEVARAAASILETDRLITQVVELIRERFDLYYVGLFLVDETGQWAVLRAGTGRAGQAMLARGHKLRIGGDSMIGWSIANAQVRIALEAGADAVRLATAALPDTRSEAALPLHSRGRVIGALTVQSAQPQAFDQDTSTALQTMADQIAIALENARLFAESQAALDAMRRSSGELSLEGWAQLLATRPTLDYRSTEGSTVNIAETWPAEAQSAFQAGQTVQPDGGGESGKLPLAVPIKVHGNVIGVLDTFKSGEGHKWSPEEIALAEALADQLGTALESARLYQDTQRRAAREQTLGHMTAEFARSLDIDTVLQTVVRELGQMLPAGEISVLVGSPRGAASRAKGEDEL
jgi:GAF domain-containing protein/HAMP domain-containing protein